MALFKKEWIRIKVIGRMLRLAAGEVKLNKKQAADRASAVKKISGTAYEIIQPVEFKRGEILEVKSECLNKVILTSVEQVDTPEKQEIKTDSTSETPVKDEPQSNLTPDSNDPTADGLLKES